MSFLPIVTEVLLTLMLLTQLFVAKAELRSVSNLPQFEPCDPVSELLGAGISSSGEPSPQFCRQWNPNFFQNGNKCCGKLPASRKKRRAAYYSGRASRRNYCSEITEEQKEYLKSAPSGKFGDILALLTREMGRRGDQAYCAVNSGFLVRGRPVIATSQNRLTIHAPERCLNFGTDSMAAMLEWLGREVAKEFADIAYSGVRLVVGDVSGPKGGHLVAPSGRRRHASHTTGQDVDIGFLTVKQGKESPNLFVRELESTNNWWLLKKIFKNPYACVKVIFLDRKHIKSLAKFAQKDEEWTRYKRFIRHMPGHKNHFHIRVGNGSGLPGCFPGAQPELEEEEDFDLTDPDDNELLDQLRASF